MKPELEQLFTKAKQISLTAKEKNSILNNIIGQVEEKTVRNTTSPRLYKLGGVATLIGSYSQISIMKYRNMLITFAFMIALLGTTGAYAQISLPGEWLYPIKIHVNEKLEYLSAMTPKAQALLEATFATRRLEEAAALLSANKLDESNSTELAAQFSVYTEKLTEHLSELRQRGKEDIANEINSSFETSKQTHQEILNVFQASSSINENSLRKSYMATSTKKKSSSSDEEKKPDVKINDDNLAPFVTTPSVIVEDDGQAVNIKETNTVEVPPYLDNTIRIKVESRVKSLENNSSK